MTKIIKAITNHRIHELVLRIEIKLGIHGKSHQLKEQATLSYLKDMGL